MQRRVIVGLAAIVMLSAPARGAPQQTTSPPDTRYLDSARARIAAWLRPDTKMPAPPDAPDAWKPLIGEYGTSLDPIIILEKDGALVALFGRVRALALKPVAGDTFSTGDARVVFSRNARGGGTAISIDNTALPRRHISPDDGTTFRIAPQQPVETLRRIAMSAAPPVEKGDFAATDLVELNTLDPTIHYDIRYATTNNFMGARFYSSAHALMQRPAALAVQRAAAQLRERGLGLLIHDAYRPWYVTKMFWDATPPPLRDFVADPASGSRHNRGAAVDLSMYDLATGRPIVAVSGYDEFSDRAYPDYPGGTTLQRWYRAVLRDAMEREGFQVYRAEWWHFDYDGWQHYRIGNIPFEQVAH